MSRFMKAYQARKKHRQQKQKLHRKAQKLGVRPQLEKALSLAWSFNKRSGLLQRFATKGE